MALKSCVYRNCENYVNVIDKTYSKENLTFFQFPKNPDRRQKWIELGKAPPSLPAHYYYYCSDHFDKRFLCVGPRRTILVGEAIPFPYEYGCDQEEDSSEEQHIPTEEQLYLYNVKDDSIAPVEEQPDQGLQVESTTMQDSDIIQYFGMDEYEPEEPNAKKVNESNRNKNNLKRRQEDCTISPITSSNQLKILKCTSLTKPMPLVKGIKLDSATSAVVNVVKTNRQETATMVPKLKDDNAGMETINPESLIDSNHVTTFIFKGEEYVQMPREHYIKEKIDMVKKLKRMEKCIAAIKEQLSGF